MSFTEEKDPTDGHEQARSPYLFDSDGELLAIPRTPKRSRPSARNLLTELSRAPGTNRLAWTWLISFRIGWNIPFPVEVAVEVHRLRRVLQLVQRGVILLVHRAQIVLLKTVSCAITVCHCPKVVRIVLADIRSRLIKGGNHL